MIPAPYLKKLNTQGGTLYVFPSVSRDLTRTLVSNDYQFSFSHFACLNLPEIKSGIYDPDADEPMDKGLYLNTLFSQNNQTEITGWTSDTMGTAIAENLQNYVMNFETAILNGMGDNDDYDDSVLTSVSEKVFWNWLRKIGGIKFTESETSEDISFGDRTVQYIGNLDVMNAVEINGDSFEELYVHIPSTAGASTVYFRTGEMTDNKNYLNKNYSIANNENNLIGRSDDGTHNGLSTRPLFDVDNGVNVYKGDVGHTIDFRDSSYAGGDGISTMNAKSLDDFEFNAVLIYYDIYEKTNVSGVKRVSTNLYGILFLEEVTDLTGSNNSGDRQGYIQRYPKKKETIYGNGNSYALKLDFKIDTIGDTEGCVYTIDGTEAQISEIADHTIAMNLYIKALEQLQRCIDFFYTQKNELVKLSERVSTIENAILGIDTVSSLKQDIKRLYDLCDSNAIVDTSALISLIDSNTKKLDNIMHGGKDLKLQFDTDVLQPGVGIGMKKELNKVTISSEQRYSIDTVTDANGNEISENYKISSLNPGKHCIVKLKPGENFAVIYINDEGDSETNFRITVDDSESNWEVGQSLKIHFVCDEGSLNFAPETDSGFIVKLGNNVTLNIQGYEFEGNNLIEIICVADNKFIYLIK